MLSTSDRKVATVDNNGKITAVGTGTATITANTYNGLKTQCKVTVKKLANSIKLDKTSITLGTGEQYDFSSYVPSGTAAYFRSYYSDDPNIAFVFKKADYDGVAGWAANSRTSSRFCMLFASFFTKRGIPHSGLCQPPKAKRLRRSAVAAYRQIP